MKSRKLLSAAIAMAVAAATAACAKPAVTGFAWKGQDGEALSFVQAESWEEGREGSFLAGHGSNRYTLAKPYTLGEGRCVELSIAAEPAAEAGPAPLVSLSLFEKGGGDKPLVSARFPLRSSLSRLALPAPPGTELSAIAVKLEPGAAGAALGQARILGIADLPAFRGLELGAEATRVSSGFSYALQEGESLLSIESPFDSRERLALVLDYAQGQASSRVEIESRAAGGAGPSFSVIPRKGEGRVVLGKEAFAERTASIRAKLPRGMELRSFRVEQLAPADYELADLGRVLGSRPSQADADYDLYRWDLLPSVLVFDFRDYAAQDRYLKRLAFFVEKAGYRGTLQTDEVIGPLHGWNAHDYRPEDLAAFFRAVAKKKFPLSAEEKALERILVERGIIRESGGSVEPGQGAIISISRESAPYLRRTFIVHESTHALFFADPEYRAFVAGEWKAMEPGEKWFWKRYFQWMVYDTSSEYLMANEYQAYLLQQPRKSVNDYFNKNLPKNLLVPDVLKREPELKEKVEAYMKQYGTSFEPRAAALEDWLARKYGIAAGRSYFVQ